ncbi:hypothetical protein K437DRAFT_256666 [Tilletiaria anomala UBC 951]|uniref:Uncharacterized protein n=1 Tax=Tilletiaria anomala (strain ATCC 24038 / CBS 436.72 / UBC 951) TaxID=1037660 RepID=A0A066W2A7_TILAU|nr:uncharacterized protein K437DRAFT_256666 [Tilletiaria anomala UBC 951]KDN45219.1 hypothetical protein K437DRAFT_256666 [Tilletiaria anomala UBC 951]
MTSRVAKQFAALDPSTPARKVGSEGALRTKRVHAMQRDSKRAHLQQQQQKRSGREGGRLKAHTSDMHEPASSTCAADLSTLTLKLRSPIQRRTFQPTFRALQHEDQAGSSAESSDEDKDGAVDDRAHDLAPEDDQAERIENEKLKRDRAYVERAKDITSSIGGARVLLGADPGL